MAHPRRLRFAIELGEPLEGMTWADSARWVEDAGYSTLFVPDHFDEGLGPIAAMASAAAVTTTLNIGSLVLAADFRHPVVLARELATIDLLSEGRLELGMGAGWKSSDYTTSGIPMDRPGVRVDRMEMYSSVTRLAVSKQLGAFGLTAGFGADEIRVEGDLAPRLNRLVKKGACAGAFRYLGLNAFLLLSENEVASGGRGRESTLGDACEAVIAAIYLDGGLGAARKFIEKGWAPQFNSGPAETKDPKTLLQEWAQGQGHPLPEYVVTGRSGPDHAPEYEIEVRIAENGSAAASGSSKRDAERQAAARMLEQLKGNT